MKVRKLLCLPALAAVLLGMYRAASATSPCCAVADDGSSCKSIQDSGSPLHGCLEVDDGTCVSGNADPVTGGPAGCTCIAGQCVVTSSNNPAQCTNDAAAACCAVGAGNNCPTTSVTAESKSTFLIAKLQKATPGSGWGEPRVAIDGTGGRWIITRAEASSGGLSRMIVFRSTDQGRTWAHTSAAPAGQIETTPDTDIVTTRTGRVIVNELDESLFRPVTSFSDDGGNTWSESSGMSPGDSDRPFLAVGPDDPSTHRPRVYLVAHSFSGDFLPGVDNIFLQTSVDNGSTFGPPVPVTLPGDEAFADLQCGTMGPSGISVNPVTGRIYVVFGTHTSALAGQCGASLSGSPQILFDSPTRIWVATSPDGTLGSWTQSLAADGSTTGQVLGLQFSPIALDTAGNVYVAYAESKSSNDLTAAIRYVHATLSDPGTGVTGPWSDPITVAPGITVGRLLAHVVAGDPGRLDFAYMTGETGADGKTQWYSTMAQTLDGLSASPHVTELRLSDSPAAVGTADELEGNCGTGPAKPIENTSTCFLARFADVYGVALDSAGFLTVAWPAAHGALDQGTFVATQVGGPSLH